MLRTTVTLLGVLTLSACGGGGSDSGAGSNGGGRILIVDSWFDDHAYIGEVQIYKTEVGIQVMHFDLGHLGLEPGQACWISRGITDALEPGVYSLRVDIHRANGTSINDRNTSVFQWPNAAGDLACKIGFVTAVPASEVLATNPEIVGDHE